MRSHLVIVPLGDGHVMSSWLDNAAEREFDLFVIDFRSGERQPPPGADYFLQRPGFKFEHLYFLTEHHAATLRQYQALWCPDDDVALDTHGINRMFRLFAEYRLQLAQPAIAEGDVSYEALRAQTEALLRYTPFVEIMCPLFTTNALFRVRHLFPGNRSGWGIDWSWSRCFRKYEMAILDATPARHTRPLASGETYEKFKRLGIDPGNDLKNSIRLHGSVPRRIMRRMQEGTLPMPTVYPPNHVRTPWQQWCDRLRNRVA